MQPPDIYVQCQQVIGQARTDGIHSFAVGAAVISEEGLLIIKRASTEDIYPDYFEIPGGGVEEGEDVVDALHRELHEETGLTIVSIEAMAGTFDYVRNDGTTVRQLNFMVRTEEGDLVLNPHEHSEYVWVSKNDFLTDMKISHDMLKSIQIVLSLLQGGSERHGG